MNAIVLLLLSIVPVEDLARERCDVLEANSFYDEQGRLVFDQLIAWDWCHDRHQVRAWRMIKGPSMWPERDWERGGYSVLWQDGEVIRMLWADSYRRTWTQYDPELVDRDYLPRDRRRELRTLKETR